MPKRKPPYRSPDGLDWRDPQMPVYAHSRTQGMVLIEPERWSRVCAKRMEMHPPEDTEQPK